MQEITNMEAIKAIVANKENEIKIQVEDDFYTAENDSIMEALQFKSEGDCLIVYIEPSEIESGGYYFHHGKSLLS